MPVKIAYLHTVLSVVGQFNDLSKELLPDDTLLYHIGDEILAKVAVAQGSLSPFLYRRVAEHVRAAEEAGAHVMQLTCSSISPCVEAVQQLVSIPVLKIDQPMVDCAITMGRRIGVAATAITALKPTSELVQRRAAEQGREVEVDTVLCQAAYKYLQSGDLATHDSMVREALLAMVGRNDVVILAQASMARVAGTISPEECQAPILSSPRLAVEHLRTVVDALPL